MLRPLVAVSVSASRASLDENLEPEQRSSRIWLSPPNEVRVVLAEDGTAENGAVPQVSNGSVATVTSSHIVVEGNVMPAHMAAQGNATETHSAGRPLLSREQHIDALASAIFHKLRSGDEVLTVAHGPSACGKTVTLLGHELDLMHTASAPPSASEGLLWHVLARVFLLGQPASSSVPPTLTTEVEVGLSVIEFRPCHPNDPSMDEEEHDAEEAVDLLRDIPDVVSPTGAFCNMPGDIPLAQYVTCGDVAEVRTALMVALSRSRSWVADDHQHVAASDASAISESRLEHASRTSADGGGSASQRGSISRPHHHSSASPQPLVPTIGGSSHLNINLIVKVVQPADAQLRGASRTSASSSRANRALNVPEDESLPSIVDTKTTCSVWRVFDLMGPQLYDFCANPVAEMAIRTEKHLLRTAMSPIQGFQRASGPAGSDSGADTKRVEVPIALPPYNPTTDSLCGYVLSTLLRDACSYTVWHCALRFDYSFDELNAEAVRLASWVSERCGRPLVLRAAQREMREKHLHVARRLMDSHAMPARAFFAEVIDLRRSTMGSRYASLAHRMAAEAATERQGLQSTAASRGPHCTGAAPYAVSPQSISLDGAGAASEVLSDCGLGAGGRSTSSMDTALSNIQRRRSSIGEAGSRNGVHDECSSGASFALETAPARKALPQSNPRRENVTRSNRDEVANAVIELESTLANRRKEGLTQTLPLVRDNLQPILEQSVDEKSSASTTGVPASRAANDAARAVATAYAAVRRGSSRDTTDDEGPGDRPRLAGGPPRSLADTAPMESAPAGLWRSVLEQFRDDNTARSGEEDLMRPSRGGCRPRGYAPSTVQHAMPQGLDVAHRDGNASSASAGQRDELMEYTRRLEDECDSLRGEVEELRSRAAGEPSRVIGSDAGCVEDSRTNDGGAGAIAQLVQPILRRLEEDSAEVLAKLLTTKRAEAEGEAQFEQSERRAVDATHSSTRGPSTHGPRALSNALPSASIRDVAELERRVRSLQRELASARTLHERGRAEVLHAANQSITSHKEAFTKILNESGSMYAKLNRLYHESLASQRETSLRLEQVTKESRQLREELATKSASEQRLRSAVDHLQEDRERLLRHEAMHNAAHTVSSVFTNASVTSNVLNASASDSTRSLFDATIRQNGNSSTSVPMDGRATQRPSAEAIGMLSFQSALNHLYRAAVAPIESLQSSIHCAADNLSNCRAAATDVTVAQSVKELQSLADDAAKKKLQVQLHVDIVRDEAAKIGTMYHESQQREQQYLHVLISR